MQTIPIKENWIKDIEYLFKTMASFGTILMESLECF